MIDSVEHVCIECGAPAHRSSGRRWRQRCYKHHVEHMNAAVQQMKDKKGPIWDQWRAATLRGVVQSGPK